MILSPVEVRVLGALIEKEIVTPENYPLSLNALVNACNQKSSREPVMELSEDEVRQALHRLEDGGFVAVAHDARVPKYENRARTVLNLRRDETAVMCLLMLRGPQTPGELRGRSERLHNFEDIASVQVTLDRLSSRDGGENEGPLTAILPRQTGSREARYVHLLGGMPEVTETTIAAPAGMSETMAQRVARLEAELAAVTETVALLKARVESLGSGL